MSGKIALDTDIAIKFLNGDKTIEIFLSKYSEFHKGKSGAVCDFVVTL